ncbi:MAG: spondin domain-containing protein, partial [Verrucomicrobiota bacterium]
SLQLTGSDPFTAANWSAGSPNLGSFGDPAPVNIRVTITNAAPANGTYLTPLWFGFHDGTFDSHDVNMPASPGLERLAEDGNPAVLNGEFSGSGSGTVQGVLNGIGPIAPGASVSRIVTIDANSAQDRFFSYASMIIPSNDAFIGNDDPTAHPIFDADGNFTAIEFNIPGSAVKDAGTEVNDEIPANTAFFGQAEPDTGTPENSMVLAHNGFNSAGDGGIVDDSMFAAADFTANDYQVATVRVELAVPNPVQVTLNLANSAPANGTFLTPVWVGFHDGSFDLFNAGEAVSPELERLAEDGNTGPLSAAFQASTGTGIDQTVISDGIPPFEPGETASLTLTLDANDPANRYLSFASMIIPSNDAFIGNDDPTAHPVFDEMGNYVGGTLLALGAEVYDAGTEVNDETPANTAFFGQAAPDTGVTEGGVATIHNGFLAPGQGGILDDPMFAAADFTAPDFTVLNGSAQLETDPSPVNVRVTITNTAPADGTYLTPLWFGFHNGSFDSHDLNMPASPGLERLAEDGNPAVLNGEFSGSGAGTVQGVLNGIGPIAPGASVSRIVTVDANSAQDRFFSYASMIIPSNDAFIGNDDPTAYPIFDADGNFTAIEFSIPGTAVKDAGTEVNDEIPANTAFFGQAAPDTGTEENGMVQIHNGFKFPGDDGIVDDPMFAAADFTANGYQVATVRVELAVPNPVQVTLNLANSAPANGTFLTPVWVG